MGVTINKKPTTTEPPPVAYVIRDKHYIHVSWHVNMFVVQIVNSISWAYNLKSS